MNSKVGYKITSRVDGESWSSIAAFVAAETEEQALSTFKTLFIRDTKKRTYLSNKIEAFKSSTVLSSQNYPYGRLRTTATFAVEFTKNGFREIFQTVDPKTGLLNKPKKSTYRSIILPGRELESQHFTHVGVSEINSTDGINKALYFLNDFRELFTVSEVSSLCLEILAAMKIDIQAICTYKGADFEVLKPLYADKINNLVHIANGEKDKSFLDSIIDIEAVEATYKENYNPFVIRRVG